MTDKLKHLALELSQLANQAVDIYSPIVDNLIQSKITDDNKIQLTLDYMLSFCFDAQMLKLYKKLCRYYYDINPPATIDYVDYYRKMWDSENNKELSI